MRNLFSFNMVTLDGFFEGPNRSIDWHNVDSEFNEFAVAQLHEIGTLLFGRITYELMASYWPTPGARENDSVVAGLMNHIPKVVFSRTLQRAEWENSQLVKDHVGEAILNLKRQDGKDMAIFGSANLLSALMKLDLVDEHRLMVNPVILGNGTPLFQGTDRTALRLVRSRPFGNGNVLLCYQPNRA